MIIQEEKVEIIEGNDVPKALKNTKDTEKSKIDESSAQSHETHLEPKKNFTPIPHDEASTKHIIKYIAIFLTILAMILLVIFGIFSIYNMNNNNKIAKGIYIYGIDVSGLTKKEASDKVLNKFNSIQATEIKLSAKDYDTTINPTEIDLKFNIDSAINYAFSIGKSGNVIKDNYDIFSTMVNGIEITPTYSMNEDSLNKLLDEISKSLPNAVVESSYYVEGNNLIITKGSEGYIVDSKKTTSDIKSNLKDLSFLTKSTELSLIKKAPNAIDLDKIYAEVHKDAKDAYYTTNPYVVHPSENGVDFKISLDEAKQKLAEADKECKIPLKTVYPKVSTNDIGSEAFPDLIAEFSTKYAASNVNRTTNLRLAANKINGTVLLPGDTFSYNKVVGERTIAAGYKDAAIYQNGEVVDGLGGGICQISTTLFNAALFANLKITEVYNHQFVPSYVGAGRDATVVYGAKDFKFTNSRKYAIKIKCSVSGGIANFKIYGVKEDTEYKVNVSAVVTSDTATSKKSTTYRTLTLNGKQVLKEKIYSCTYKKH